MLLPLSRCVSAEVFLSKARIVVPEEVWNCRVTVAADEAQNEGGAPKYVGHRADVEAGPGRAGAGCWPNHRECYGYAS